MLGALTLLLVCRLAGEVAAQLLPLPVPGLLQGTVAIPLCAPSTMGIAEKSGELRWPATLPVISAGIIDAVIGCSLPDAIRIDDHAVRGFASGVASHGIARASEFQVSEVAEAFAALAMALDGAATTVLRAFIAAWIGAR